MSVPDLDLRGSTGDRPPGSAGHQPVATVFLSTMICEKLAFQGKPEPDNSLQSFSGAFSFQILTTVDNTGVFIEVVHYTENYKFHREVCP